MALAPSLTAKFFEQTLIVFHPQYIPAGEGHLNMLVVIERLTGERPSRVSWRKLAVQ